MDPFILHPEISFEDTNLVGNVYFANFVRWQNNCRNDWLKQTDFLAYSDVFQGHRRIVVHDLELQFHDPAGARLGDQIEVRGDFTLEQPDHYSMTFQAQRLPAMDSTTRPTLLATGRQTFSISDEGFTREGCQPSMTVSAAPAFSLEFPVPLTTASPRPRLDSLDLIRWQGKCREQFLARHAPHTLKAVAEGQLALHTNRVGCTLIQNVEIGPSDRIRLQMRMTDIKSRLTVEFDYFLVKDGPSTLDNVPFATGIQVLCCKRRTGQQDFAACVLPVEMLQALRPYADSDRLHSAIDLLLEHQSLHQPSQAYLSTG